jgi:hypothetical protein
MEIALTNMGVVDTDRHVANIARANDVFRKLGFCVTITQGIHALPDVGGLLVEVSRFNTFTEDNDPHGEHDFGSLFWHGNKIFWKIDYYNQLLTGWCDPLSDNCRRILTVMLADEY